MTGLLVAAAIFLPIAVGAAVAIGGAARRRAPWPWLIGLGVAFVPACWMAAADLCGSTGGTCIPADELSNSRLAAVSVIAFVIATGLLAVRRGRARDAAFAVLVLFGQLWLLLRFRDAGLREPEILVIALIVLETGYEAAVRARPAAAAA